jgi:hypothetical protein
MKTQLPILSIPLFLLALLAAYLLTAPSASAHEELPPIPGASVEHDRHFDWMKHTQRTLGELKAKLNLTPAQLAGWDTWSQGVLDDGKQQLAQRKSERDQTQIESKATDGETTPEKMTRGIARLKSETAWMQQHLVELEAAQVRTGTFYGTLETNQKTIFDLFWHELYHRISGHDQGSNVTIDRIAPPVT